MSSADDTDDETRGVGDHPTVTTTPVGNAAQPAQDDARAAHGETSATVPWKRATSTFRDDGSTSSQQPPAGGHHSANAGDGAGGAAQRQAAWTPSEQHEQPQRPLVTGTAAASVLGEQGGQQDAQEGRGRAAVNLGSVTSQQWDQQSGGGGRGPTPSALRRPGRGPRRASLQLKRFDPWSVLKLALVLCIAMFFVWMVAVGVLYGALDGMGVWDKINGTYNSLTAPKGGGGGSLISAGSVFGIAAIVGAINIILFTALATIGAFVYNVSADLVGGLEVTLAERE